MDNQQRNPDLFKEIITKYNSGESMNKLSQEYNINIKIYRKLSYRML